MAKRKRNPAYRVQTYPVRGRKKDLIELRPITFEEALNLRYRDEVYILDREGRAARIRVNSKVKTWKREPGRIEIGFAFGLYEKFRLGTEEILRDVLVSPYEYGDI